MVACACACGCAATEADFLAAQLDRLEAEDTADDEDTLTGRSPCPDEEPIEGVLDEDLPQPRPSPSRRYNLKVCTSQYTHSLQVRRLADGHVTVIDPNPGGGTGSGFEVQFTPGDNLLAGWGCGTYCAVNVLYSPEGVRLGSWDAHSLSPGGSYAVTFPISPHPTEANIDLVDLRSGIVVHEEHHAGFEVPCDVVWESGAVTLKPCDAATSPITLPGGEP